MLDASTTSCVARSDFRRRCRRQASARRAARADAARQEGAGRAHVRAARAPTGPRDRRRPARVRASDAALRAVGVEALRRGMATILLLSGPNLNLFGEREPDGLRHRHARRHGRRRACRRRGRRAHARAPAVEPRGRRSSTRSTAPAAAAPRSCVNAGALTHYSFALADALQTFDGVKVELHVSNPASREDWRRTLGRRALRHRDDRRLRPAGLPAGARSRRRQAGGIDEPSTRPPFPRWTSPAAVAGACGAASTRPGSTRCSSPAARTSGTSPGSPGRPAMLLVGPTSAVLVTDGRYAEQSREQLDAAGVDARIEIAPTAAAQRDGARAPWPPGSPGSGSRRTASPGRSSAPTPSGFDGAELVPTERAGRGRCRRVKEPAEVARIRAACAIADDALAARAPDAARPGRRSGSSRSTLEFAMRDRGASGNSFDTDRRVGPERREAARAPERPRRSSAASSS